MSSNLYAFFTTFRIFPALFVVFSPFGFVYRHCNDKSSCLWNLSRFKVGKSQINNVRSKWYFVIELFNFLLEKQMWTYDAKKLKLFVPWKCTLSWAVSTKKELSLGLLSWRLLELFSIPNVSSFICGGLLQWRLSRHWRDFLLNESNGSKITEKQSTTWKIFLYYSDPSEVRID